MHRFIDPGRANIRSQCLAPYCFFVGGDHEGLGKATFTGKKQRNQYQAFIYTSALSAIHAEEAALQYRNSKNTRRKSPETGRYQNLVT